MILCISLVFVAAALAVAYLRSAGRKRSLHHGDALSLLAIAALSNGPAALNDELLGRITDLFHVITPRYATRENAALILAVLEVCEAVETTNGVVALTHRGLQMRLNLAKGQPPRGLAAAFERKRRAFALTQAA
ncbi:MAG TPA: hypothetical protein VFE17_09305 [Candidatus Baltobacteraceae bacterium]|jgi:hypothetical protein|nr:hypothetical protein [Candidatus Baltobacteraceae bacterium]